MCSLFILALFLIAQIVTAQALVHGHYPRFNHGDNPNIQWMMKSVRHTRHGPIYRSVPDPTPVGLGASAFDSSAFRDPIFISKALASVVLLAYFAIALGYAIRRHKRKLRSGALDPTRLSTCCESSCIDCNEA